VTYEFEAGVVLDGDRVAGNAFYLNGGDDTTVKSLDLSSKVKMIEFAETVIYTSQAERFKLLGLYTGFSGNDSSSTKLDHGVYVDGSVGWLIEDHVSEGMTAHGIQIYSGSSRTTTGTVRRAKLFNNAGDGLHVGNASTNSTPTSSTPIATPSVTRVIPTTTTTVSRTAQTPSRSTPASRPTQTLTGLATTPILTTTTTVSLTRPRVSLRNCRRLWLPRRPLSLTRRPSSPRRRPLSLPSRR
jgi:hypothetical protein